LPFGQPGVGKAFLQASVPSAPTHSTQVVPKSYETHPNKHSSG